MTPAEEDALYEEFDNDRHSVIGTRGAFLVAIRAAVAQERERAARICDRWSGVGDVVSQAIAAAIRRGE